MAKSHAWIHGACMNAYAHMHTQNVHRYITYVHADRHTLYTQIPVCKCIQVIHIHIFTHYTDLLACTRMRAHTDTHTDAGTFVTDKH